MSLVKDGLDLIKASKDWKDEYQKKNNKDLYIHRLEDLNDKLCDENSKLKNKINNTKKGNDAFYLDDSHFEVINIILNHCDDDYVFYDSSIKEIIKGDINKKIAYHEIYDSDYIAVAFAEETKCCIVEIAKVLKFYKEHTESKNKNQKDIEYSNDQIELLNLISEKDFIYEKDLWKVIEPTIPLKIMLSELIENGVVEERLHERYFVNESELRKKYCISKDKEKEVFEAIRDIE